MILQNTGDAEDWYYFFENKEVYDELATLDAYVIPDPATQAILAERLRMQPKRFEILTAEANDYFLFRFRYLEKEKPEAYLPYRILYYPWDDEGYFYMVDPDVFKEKTLPQTERKGEQPFEPIPLAQEKELLFELDTDPDKFDITSGAAHDFFYQKFRIKSM